MQGEGQSCPERNCQRLSNADRKLEAAKDEVAEHGAEPHGPSCGDGDSGVAGKKAGEGGDSRNTECEYEYKEDDFKPIRATGDEELGITTEDVEDWPRHSQCRQRGQS
jgi:hypothetical protein